MINYNKPIAELKNFIILDRYSKIDQVNEPYQSENSLENQFIDDLQKQGFEYLPSLKTPEALIENLRIKIEELNSVHFSDSEWGRFLEEYLDKSGDSIVDKTHKIHDDYIYDFVFDDGHIQNIYLIDKKNIARNKV